MDITNLTAQITSLRAETQERSITPERVGSMLQQLANLIKTTAESAATQNDIYEITDNAISNFLTNITATANGATISLTMLELDGETFEKTIALPIASNSQAGLLSAADYAAIMNAIQNMENNVGLMTDEERAKLNNLAARFKKLGGPNSVWVSSHDAEIEAAKLENCSQPDIWMMYYYVQGSKYGLIEQHVCGDVCIQTLHWDSKVYQRTITFANTDRTALNTVGAWSEIRPLTTTEIGQLKSAAGTTSATFTAGESSQKSEYKIWLTLRNVTRDTSTVYDVEIPLASSETMGVMSSADKVKLDSLPDAATLAAALGRDKMGVYNLGHVGNASAPGESAAAALTIVSDPLIKWVIYTYSTNVAIIHQTHNGTTTVQDMYFAGNKHSRRTITFTDSARTAIASVGGWSSIGSDIGVNRNASTATIKMVHPFMENNEGVLALTIGQASESMAGLMTAANVRSLNAANALLNSLTEDVGELTIQLEELQNTVTSLQNIINGLGDIYVRKPSLLVTASPSYINISTRNYSNSGGTIAAYVIKDIYLTAFDEDNNEVDVRGCQISWDWSSEYEANAFSVQYEGEKRYVIFSANEGDTWIGNSSGKLLISVSDGRATGTAEVTLNRILGNA